MQFPFTIGDELEVADADLMSSVNLKQLTAGESIDASSTPLAVYLKASDGKVWLTDTDADESTFKFIGFVGQGQNVSADDDVIVTTGGILDGFTGMTAGNRMYLGATAGVLGTTPIADQGIEVGIVISATQLFIIGHTIKIYTGSDSSASGFVNETNTVIVGFRPRIIHYVITGADGNEGNNSWGIWTEGVYQTTQFENPIMTVQSTNALTNTFTDSALTITFGSITSTGFSITYTKRGVTWASEGTVKFTVIG